MNERDKELAKQAGLNDFGISWQLGALEKFADLIRADEREACAKVCDELHWPWNMGDNSGPKECAAGIRARGIT